MYEFQSHSNNYTYVYVLTTTAVRGRDIYYLTLIETLCSRLYIRNDAAVRKSFRILPYIINSGLRRAFIVLIFHASVYCVNSRIEVMAIQYYMDIRSVYVGDLRR